MSVYIKKDINNSWSETRTGKKKKNFIYDARVVKEEDFLGGTKLSNDLLLLSCMILQFYTSPCLLTKCLTCCYICFLKHILAKLAACLQGWQCWSFGCLVRQPLWSRLKYFNKLMDIYGALRTNDSGNLLTYSLEPFSIGVLTAIGLHALAKV